MAIDKKYINHFIYVATKVALASSFQLEKKIKLQKNKKFKKKVCKDQGGKIVTCDPKSGE